MSQLETSPGYDTLLKQGQGEVPMPVVQATPLGKQVESASESQERRKPRALLVIALQPPVTLPTEIARGEQPRRDYYALQQALDADLLFLDDARQTLLGKLIARLVGKRPALAWAAFRRRHAYDQLYTESELIGLPLALLLKLSGISPARLRHVLLTHYLSPFKKRIFFRLGVGSHISTLIVHSAAQYADATQRLHMPSERVVKLPYFVDQQFWRPDTLAGNGDQAAPLPAEGKRPMICASGLEFRDYPTLLKAVDGLDVEAHVAAGSASMFQRAAVSARYRATAQLPAIPPNVSVRSRTYAEMRQLYAAARFVVVPLRDAPFQAGIIVILEAMAMGKAVIVSGTRGQTDVVRDPRNNGRGLIRREWWPRFLDAPGVAETLGTLPTGFYVTPGDPD